MSPPPQRVRCVLMVDPSLKVTWSAAISFADTPSLISTPRRWSCFAA